MTGTVQIPHLYASFEWSAWEAGVLSTLVASLPCQPRKVSVCFVAYHNGEMF